MSSALLLVAAIPAGLAAGCFLSLEGYEGPPEAPPEIEADPPDVGAGGDVAEVSTGDAGSDGARRFCDMRTPGVIFCDDFDDDAGFGKGRLKNVFNGSVEIDSVHASSPPHALHVERRHRVELTIDAARQPANVGYSIDGQALLNSATRVTGAPWKSGLVTVQLGADATGGAGLGADIVLHFDNPLVSNE